MLFRSDLIRVSKEEDAKREKEEKNDKRTKGYGYDSLVFRFKESRYKQAELEAIEAKKAGKDPYTAKKGQINVRKEILYGFAKF